MIDSGAQDTSVGRDAPSRELFGAMAVRKGFVTKDQLEDALAMQKQIVAEGRQHQLIGLVMLTMGFLSNSQLIAILKDIEARRGESVD